MRDSIIYVATDVGLWMALPAFGPALLLVGVFVYIIRRDRRSEPSDSETTQSGEGNDPL